MIRRGAMEVIIISLGILLGGAKSLGWRIPCDTGQEPMGASSSSGKNREWAVTLRRCLNGSTIPVQAPAVDAQ